MPGGRPIKNGVDYFPLDVVLDDKLELIESEHGIQGFGVVIKLYQKIYADNYYIKWDKKALLVFSNRINVDINSINAIINSCMEWDVFSSKMYKEYEILTSTGIQKRFFEIVKRRKVVEVCKDFLLIKLDVNAYRNLINVDRNSQRKGKEKEREKYSDKLKKFVVDFIEYIKKNEPSKLPRSDNLLESSLDTLEKLSRIDGFEEEYIFKIIRWAKKDSFWQNQIYSLAGLRKKNDSGIMKFQSIIISYDKKASTEPKQKTREQLLKEYSH